MLNSLTIILKKLLFFIPQFSLRQSSERIQKRQAAYLPSQADILASIDLSCLISFGICGVILDLDNTIVSEDDRYLSPNAEIWIEQAKGNNIKFFLLSNGKKRYRVEYWSARLDIPAISPARKPFPKAFRRAIKHMQLQPKQVAVIGDSRHTDVLGAWLAGCTSIQVASLPHPPRWWEKLLGKYVQKPYPKGLSLWNF
ncbi:YqeG family HAD IIIA-type phosphatase [Pseudanabaena sp. PCC 6802]|uniref:YqeG family HAD IIIA-type phosphatase n=1 Tax=Pseudanabaena sp. PCC 6802 TaxID=118173 RepID=UPI00034D6D87|nr:YqeG family HAD IIIA-type phosphatase [Pseudanabaena sp. PCC 6802]